MRGVQRELGYLGRYVPPRVVCLFYYAIICVAKHSLDAAGASIIIIIIDRPLLGYNPPTERIRYSYILGLLVELSFCSFSFFLFLLGTVVLGKITKEEGKETRRRRRQQQQQKMSRPWVLITPSSRGIGFYLTRHLLQRTALPILATCRQDPEGVKARLVENLPLGPTSSSSSSYEKRLTVVPLDVTSEPTLSSAAAQAARRFPPETHHLRLAFAMTGVLARPPEKSTRLVDAEQALLTYRVNTLGPLLLMKWFGDFLPRKRTKLGFDSDDDDANDDEEERRPTSLSLPDHAVWMAMSARVGSTSDNRTGGWYSYRSSKAGVNSLVKSFDHQLAARSGDKAMAVAYHPGTVRTDLSKDYWATVDKDKLFEPEFAVEKMVEVVTSKVGLEGRGRCWDWKGDEILP